MGALTVIPKLSRISILLATIQSCQAMNLFSRASSTCGDISGLSSCGANYPSSFCCPTDSTCVPLNSTGAISVICCPSGADCTFIQPITCDISQLNATQHPDNQIHISNTTAVDLPTCGSDGKCCPLGYSCNGGMCSADTANTSPSPSASSTPSQTRAPAAAQTTGSLSTPTPEAKSTFNGNSFAAGFFPGILLGALGTVGLIYLVRKHRERASKTRYSGDFGHVARTISDPIYDPEYAAARTDFVRQQSESNNGSPSYTRKSAKVVGGGGGGLTPRIKSLWARSPRLGLGTWSPSSNTIVNPQPPPPAAMHSNMSNPLYAHANDPFTTPPKRTSKGKRPVTDRSGSTETIDVLMPAPSFLEPPKAPGMRENRLTQDTTATTFTKLMERAGYAGDEREEVREWRDSPGKGKGKKRETSRNF